MDHVLLLFIIPIITIGIRRHQRGDPSRHRTIIAATETTLIVWLAILTSSLCNGVLTIQFERTTDESYYNHNGRLTMVRKNWMKSVSNDTYLYQLSLPGTHDSMALYGGPIFQTQSMTLYSQLRVGIRTLDIRCRHIGDRFEIYHGPVFQRANFDHVLISLTNFLESYPSEVILMRVKEEHVPRNNTRSFLGTFEYYLDKPLYRQYFWIGDHASVQLGAVRGKIIILRDFPAKNTIIIPWNSVDYQDEYILPTLFSIRKKWEKVFEHLEKSKYNRCPVLMGNFLSGTSVGAYPFSVARRVNRLALEWLIRNQVDSIGMIYMDFPGEGLIRTIINLNYGLRIINAMGDGAILRFLCNSGDMRNKSDQDSTNGAHNSIINLDIDTSHQYAAKHYGPNVCKFWARQRVATLSLSSGNENIVVTEIGFYRERDGFVDRQELKRWPSNE